MKKLPIIAILLLLIASVAQAHNGSIGLYTDDTGADCDGDITLYTEFNLYLVYFKSDGGPDMGQAYEFKLETDGATLQFMTPTWPPTFQATIGDLLNGIAVTHSDCLGSAGQQYVWLGTIPVMSFAETSLYVHVAAHPTSVGGPGVKITACETGNPKYVVLGGWFHFPNGSCDMGVEPATWGSIKSLLNE